MSPRPRCRSKWVISRDSRREDVPASEGQGVQGRRLANDPASLTILGYQLLLLARPIQGPSRPSMACANPLPHAHRLYLSQQCRPSILPPFRYQTSRQKYIVTRSLLSLPLKETCPVKEMIPPSREKA